LFYFSTSLRKTWVKSNRDKL